MISYIMSDQSTHLEEMINLNQPSIETNVSIVPRPAAKKSLKSVSVNSRPKTYAFEAEKTITEEACIKS